MKRVNYWAYQIQKLDRAGAVEALVASKYDMLVLEPTNTDRGGADFDAKSMVTRLHNTTGKSGHKRLVIAYVDIGEAESWRYYWKGSWSKPSGGEPGDPDFLIAPDPGGWEGCYPVAYWDKRWKEIMIHAADSMLNRLIDDGFDGIYMDWVEAYSFSKVRKAAKEQGLDPAREMITFIAELRRAARARRPDFLIIAQNSSELATAHPDYLQHVDGIAQEQIFYDGEADTGWKDSRACDMAVPAEGEGYSQAYYSTHLQTWLDAGLPVFNVEYACDGDNVERSYAESAKLGYVTYVSRRPLDQLTADHPPGYL